jgi:hypothetical protein
MSLPTVYITDYMSDMMYALHTLENARTLLAFGDPVYVPLEPSTREALTLIDDLLSDMYELITLNLAAQHRGDRGWNDRPEDVT